MIGIKRILGKWLRSVRPDYRVYVIDQPDKWVVEYRVESSWPIETLFLGVEGIPALGSKRAKDGAVCTSIRAESLAVPLFRHRIKRTACGRPCPRPITWWRVICKYRVLTEDEVRPFTTLPPERSPEVRTPKGSWLRYPPL